MPNRFPTLLVRIWESCHKKFASNVIAVSNAVKNNLTIAGAVVVYEGLPKPYKTLLAPAAAPKMNTRTLLYLSNYIDGKGHEFALLSFEKLADRYPFWKLRFVGGDMGTKKNQTYKEYLVNKAIEMNLHDQVEWIGFCEDVSKEYHVADVVLNFSNSESFSLTCLEAMSAGRPVISTDSGGPAEIIKHNESGILVPVGDVQAMHEAMDLLMSNPQLRETMGNKAFYQVRDKFNFDETISKLKTIYLKALGS
jgi:glycosyltransferase involved in cell wall biosynthesis